MEAAPREPLPELPDGLGRDRRAAVAEGAEGRARAPVARLEQHHHEDGRRGDHVGDPLEVDQAQGLGGVERRHHDDRAAEVGERQELGDQARDVEERDRHEGALAGAETVAAFVGDRRVDDAEVRAHRSLGASRGAGSVHDERRVLLVDQDGGRRRALGEQLGVGRPVVRLAGQTLADRVDLGPLLGVREEDAGARVLEHELELPGLEFGVERHRDRAELGAGEDGHAERRAVPEQHGDPVAGLDAVAAVERGGEPARALGELAPGEPLGGVDDRVAVREALGGTVEEPAHRARPVGRVTPHPPPEVRLLDEVPRERPRPEIDPPRVHRVRVRPPSGCGLGRTGRCPGSTSPARTAPSPPPPSGRPRPRAG